MEATINWLAVLAAGISAFFLGGIWYSPALLGKAWMKQNNFTEEDLKRGGKAKIFAWAFVLSLVMAVNLAMYLGSGDIGFAKGTLFGALAGVWIFCGIAIVALFERRSASYIFINGGYCLVALAIMGAIIGSWR